MLRAKQPPQPIQLIRFALAAGVLLFGAVTVFVHTQPNWKAVALPAAANYAVIAMAFIAVAVAGTLRARVARETIPQRKFSLLLTGWSVGEVAGLCGAVIFFVTGQSEWFLVGLLGMAVSFMMLRP